MFLRTNKAEAAALNSAGPNNAKKGVPSVISADMHILGNMMSEGHVDVDGSIEGNVKAEQVTVRANGKVKGDITAQTVHVYGEVRGLIRAHGVHLYSSCHVEGVIIHQSLSIEDGAFVDGKFKHAQDKTLNDHEEPSDSGEDGFTEMVPMPGQASLRLIG